ncbi:MAG: FAD-binding oxidoreductase [Variovorax sp.]|nr:MAG: FAD-binding oxidoreductase [Variovorax sp.]
MNATTKPFDTDVLVLGGGLMGTTAAFFLRKHHGRSVTLLERELVGRQASGTNFGNVRRQGRELIQMPLANRARAVWGRIHELLGEDAEFVPYGHLRVCYTHEQAARIEAHANEAKHHGLDLEIFTAEQLKKRWGIFAPGVVAGSLSPEVMTVERDGTGFVAHTADGGRFRAQQLLVACGAWSNRIASQFGETVPMEARGPQMGVTEPLPYAIGPSIGLSSPIETEGLYFRQIARGNIVFGGGLKGPAEADAIRAYVKPDNVLRQMRELRRFVPAFGQVQLIRVWSGIEGYTADWQPVMGPSARVPGLHYAFGFNGEGFAISPGVGETMAEVIATGRTEIPIAPFSIGRFASQQAEQQAEQQAA